MYAQSLVTDGSLVRRWTMERHEVIRILESLANGDDPRTRQRLPPDVLQNSDIVRALFTACSLLKDDDPAPRQKRSSLLVSAGSLWSREENERLGREFDSGMTVSQIALQHGR